MRSPWFRAFRRHGIVLPIWRIHRHIGMGGDQLIGALTDERFEEREGDSIRAAEKVLYMELIGEVEPMQGPAATGGDQAAWPVRGTRELGEGR